MGMSVGSGSEDGVMIDINTTPLIDIMLVLLIMFIITIPVQVHAVKLDNPPPNKTPPLEKPPVIQVDIDFDGSIYWNGQLTPVSDLDRLFREVPTMAVVPDVRLRPEPRTRYEVVMQVMAAAQRNGVKKMGIVGNERFAEGVL